MEWSCFTTGGQLLIIISQHLLFLVLGRVVFLEKNLDLCSKVLCKYKMFINKLSTSVDQN